METRSLNLVKVAILIMATASNCNIGLAAENTENNTPNREVDRKRWPSISALRPLGTKCGPNDSASIRRIPAIPWDYRSGWLDKKADCVDLTRTNAEMPANHLVPFQNTITGYVSFDRPGYLQARCYDDVYGDIYCGWSPAKLFLKPSKKRVSVSLGTCTMVNGAPDIVHEVCWFLDDATEGKVVYSSRYPPPGRVLNAAEIYTMNLRDESVYRFDRHGVQAVQEFLRKGDLPMARRAIGDARKFLVKNSAGTDPDSASDAKFMNNNLWSTLVTFELGLSLGEPSFRSGSNELVAILGKPHRANYENETYYRKMLPMFEWFNDKITDKQSGEPPTDYSSGDNQKFIETELDKSEFWTAAYCFRHNDLKGANMHLDKFLSVQQPVTKSFEVGAAAKLKELIKQRTK